MSEFGTFVGYESVVFRVAIEPQAVPLALFFVMPDSQDREFLFVPDGQAVQDFPELANLSHSATLGASFRYLGGSETEVPVASTSAIGVNRRREMRFAVVRWARGGRTPFPTRVLSAQSVSFGSERRQIIELVPAVAVEQEFAEVGK